MQHRSQATVVVFAKKHLHDNSPTIVEELHHQLSDLLDNKLGEHLMWFGSSLRGIRAYQTKCRSELTNMITQLGCPYLFFTLSVPNTKWLELHNLMPIHPHSRSLNESRRKIKNVMQYLNIVATYMHHRFNIFRQEVIKKYHKAKYFWYMFVLLNFFSILFQLLLRFYLYCFQ